MSTQEVTELLRRAAGRMTVHGWDPRGEGPSRGIDQPESLLTALANATDESWLYAEAVSDLAAVLQVESLRRWERTRGRTHEDVLRLLRQTEAQRKATDMANELTPTDQRVPRPADERLRSP